MSSPFDEIMGAVGAARRSPQTADLARSLRQAGRPQLPATINRASLQAPLAARRGDQAAQSVAEAQLQAQIAQLSAAVAALAAQQSEGGRVVLGGSGYRRSLVAHVQAGRSKGGILQTSEVTVTAGAVADTVYQSSLEGTDLSRAVDTFIHAIALVGSGEILDDAEARRMRLTMMSAGVAVEPLIRVPADVLFPDALGQESLYELTEPIRVPSDPDIAFQLALTDDLTTTTDSTVRVRLYCGGL